MRKLTCLVMLHFFSEGRKFTSPDIFTHASVFFLFCFCSFAEVNFLLIKNNELSIYCLYSQNRKLITTESCQKKCFYQIILFHLSETNVRLGLFYFKLKRCLKMISCQRLFIFSFALKLMMPVCALQVQHGHQTH